MDLVAPEEVLGQLWTFDFVLFSFAVGVQRLGREKVVRPLVGVQPNNHHWPTVLHQSSFVLVVAYHHHHCQTAHCCRWKRDCILVDSSYLQATTLPNG